MKKTLFFFVCATVIALTSCQNAPQPQQTTETIKAPAKKPDLTVSTVTPMKVAITAYNHSETLDGTCDGGNCVAGNFTMTVTLSDYTTHDVYVDAQDYWQKGSKTENAVNTMALKKLYGEVAKSKAQQFSIVLKNNVVNKVVLLPVVKAAKNGQVAMITRPEKVVWTDPAQPQG